MTSSGNNNLEVRSTGGTHPNLDTMDTKVETGKILLKYSKRCLRGKCSTSTAGKY